MSQVRFIADLHLGHENMAIKRGFKDAEEHDQHIKKCWNSVVHKKDTVYILGDVSMERKDVYPFLNELNGRKIVILGNHDMRNHIHELLKYVDQVAGMMRYAKKGFPKIWLTHCPVHPMELLHRVRLNIHGHIHELSVLKHPSVADELDDVDERYICVSCEHVDYTPKTLDQLIDMENWEW